MGSKKGEKGKKGAGGRDGGGGITRIIKEKTPRAKTVQDEYYTNVVY